MTERKSSFTYEELIECGEKGLRGPGTAQLPVPPMLMADRITHISDEGGAYGKGQVIAELDVKPDQWFFECHFPNDPVMPGCLGLDALWQLTGFYLGWAGSPGHGRALGAGQVKFSGQVRPENKLIRYEVDIRRAMHRKLVLAYADGKVFVDDNQIYEAKDLRVGLFPMEQLEGSVLG